MHTQERECSEAQKLLGEVQADLAKTGVRAQSEGHDAHRVRAEVDSLNAKLVSMQVCLYVCVVWSLCVDV